MNQVLINGNLTFFNGPKVQPWSPPDCIVLDGSVFDNFAFTDELLRKALQRLGTRLSVSKSSKILNLLYQSFFL